jgi:hypothetical protein
VQVGAREPAPPSAGSRLTKTGSFVNGDEAVFSCDETHLKPRPDRIDVDLTWGFDHAGHHHQPHLSANLQVGDRRHSKDTASDLSRRLGPQVANLRPVTTFVAYMRLHPSAPGLQGVTQGRHFYRHSQRARATAATAPTI